MSKSDVYENSLLKLIFNGTPFAGLADNAATAPNTNLFVALHTADPGETGSQNTSEVSYTGYSRASVARSAAGWTVTGNSVSPAANIEFGAATAGTATATHITIGTAASGAGVVLYRGALSPAIAISNGVIPRINSTSTVTED